MAKWGFLTNHALVLFHVYQHPQSTLREIAEAVGITERAALSCLRLMEAEGLVSRTKEGRRNRYTVNVAGVLAYGLWWPWGDGVTISLRIGLDIGVMDEPYPRFREVFGVQI